MFPPSSKPLAIDHNGNRLISLTPGTEDDLPGGAPTPMALTALRHHNEIAVIHRLHLPSLAHPPARPAPSKVHHDPEIAHVFKPRRVHRGSL
ncbi:hypothetical protein ABZ848_48920 [Streptomyces sp. NPDC047081]|uniref:hypothetical protein n=1 Tax=Streptomyces sp. NPDC047081 TaxID=3154706 RepID=UPI0033DE8772